MHLATSGANIPSTKNTFGGSSTAEFGPLLQLAYPAATPPGNVTEHYNNFRRILLTKVPREPTGHLC
jgi:hypothetical protein